MLPKSLWSIRAAAKTSQPERFINANLEEEEPVAVWVEEVNGKKKYDLHVAEENGEIHIVD